MSDAPPRKKLVQTRFFRRQQSFEIMEGHELQVAVNGPFKEECWKTPLREIDPDPVRIRNLDPKPLLLAIPFSLVTIFALVGVIYMIFDRDFEAAFGYTIAVVVMGIFAVGFWSIFLKNMTNVLSFSGPTGVRLPLWFNNPSPEKFEEFVGGFKEAIRASRVIKPDDSTLAGEIQKLKDLLDRGILDRDQFESAKNRLTGNEANRKVGF